MIHKDVLAAWPNCATPDCENKACARRKSSYCAPCTFRLNAYGSAPAGHFDEFDRLKEERK